MSLLIKYIQSKLDAMATIISDKGWKNAETNIWIESGGRFSCIVKGKHPTLTYEHNYFESADFDDVESALDGVEILTRKLPYVSESEKKNALETLGKTIDLFKELGMEIEYLNPLTETMKALSENIITDQTNA